MSVPPYMIGVFRDDAWTEVMSDDLVPGDLVSISESRAWTCGAVCIFNC